MGRFYSTNHFIGKFGFGTQSSSDPGDFFEMEENWIHPEDMEDFDEEFGFSEDQLTYDMQSDFENVGKTFLKINELYDKIGLENEKRKFIFKSSDELIAYVDSESFKEKIFMPISDEEKKNYRGMTYVLPGVSPGSFAPKTDDSVLCENRIFLGLCILNDMLMDGYCHIDADY